MAKKAQKNFCLGFDNSNMEKAVTYNRFSPGPDQREESITGQLRENHRLAKEKGLTVVHDYIDRSISARTDNRPSFQQMIKDAEKGLFSYIICYQTSRFARDKYDAVVYKRKLKKLGVKVLYSKMNIPDGPEGIILESVLEGLDEYYSQELKQKVIRGMYDNALQGKASGGIIPYGLKLDENKHYIIDEEKSPFVREIFERYAAGENREQIARSLNNRGLRTTTGKLFNTMSIYRILTQEKLKGVLSFKSQDPDLKPIYNTNVIEPIVKEELFDKVQRLLQANRHKKNKEIVDQTYFMLSGKAYDGNCGGALVGDSGTSRNGKTHYYYTCHNKKNKKKCKTKSLRKDFFEDLVVSATKDYVLKEKFIEYVADCIVKLQEKNIDETSLNIVKKELSHTQSCIKNIMNAIEKGIITDTTKERLVELEIRQAQLENQIKIESLKLTAPKVCKEQIIYWLETFKNGKNNNEAYKMQIISTFVNTVIVNDETITIAYNYIGEKDLIDIDFDCKLKEPSDSVRMTLLNWA